MAYEDRFNVIPLASYKEGSVLPIEKLCRIDSPNEEHCFTYDAKIKHHKQTEMLPYYTYRIYFRYDPLLASDWTLSFPLFSISATDFHINGQREMPMRMNFPINKSQGEITVSFITADYQNQMSGYVLRHQESTYIDVAIDWFFLGLMAAFGIYLTALTVQRRFHIPYVLVTLIVLCGLWKTINSTWILPTYLIQIGFYQWLTQDVIWQIFWAEIQVFIAVAMFSYVPTHFLLVRYRLLSRRYAMFYATCCVLMIPVGVAGIRCYSQFHSLIDFATASLLLLGSGVQVHLLWRLLRLNDRNARFIAFGIFILNASIAWNIANYTLFGNSLPILEKPGMFVFMLMHAIALSQDFADSFDENLVLTKQLEKRNAELNGLNTTLAERVAIQTAEIRSILDHIPQGVLRLMPGGIISDSASARAIEIFGTETIQGRTFREVAIDQSQASADERDQAWQSFQAIIGEDLLAFDMNRDKLPAEIRLPEKVLAVTYTPESYGSLECQNLLLTVTDITVEKKLAAAKERQDAIMDLVRELVHVEDDAKLVQFISSTDRLVGLMTERFGTAESLSTETLKFLFIMLHTIKGEARTLNLSKFSSGDSLHRECCQ
ncbi:7TM-DISM domain-containing protein [Oligoflexus tunisiensis]|uniref:7TM-DISM domain-containing protein n=1 Tax=Oligoflexus tunisiensis TaxID=708132 RepID=UPI001C4054C3|nr:7TM-DISM domain-containing protein [Oligoflexus tunisiensis]